MDSFTTNAPTKKWATANARNSSPKWYIKLGLDNQSLTYADKPAGKNVVNFVVAIDRGTETIEPGEQVQKTGGFFRQSSILLKYVIYANAYREKSCQYFGFGVFRVLMVTTTPARMEAMQKLEGKHLAGQPFGIRPGFILYTNRQTVAENGGDIISTPWKTRSGNEVFLDGR